MADANCCPLGWVNLREAKAVLAQSFRSTYDARLPSHSSPTLLTNLFLRCSQPSRALPLASALAASLHRCCRLSDSCAPGCSPAKARIVPPSAWGVGALGLSFSLQVTSTTCFSFPSVPGVLSSCISFPAREQAGDLRFPSLS